MALIDITPKMTTNILPEPYKASGSSAFSTSYDFYKAFNGTITDSVFDCWASKVVPAWLMIDMGTSTKIKAISIQARQDSSHVRAISAPKHFSIQGSNDNLSFVNLGEYTNEVNWKNLETRLYVLENEVSYRYYRIFVKSNNSSAGTSEAFVFTCIANIRFYSDNLERVNSTSSIYTLPSNTKENLDSRTLDTRTGLLAYVDDQGDSYGELRLLNNRGRFIIPKGEHVAPDILFNGKANIAGAIYELADSIYNYKYITIHAGAVSAVEKSIIIPTSDIIIDGSRSETYTVNVYASVTYSYYISISFTTDFRFRVDNSLNVGWTAPYISKITGIK